MKVTLKMEQNMEWENLLQQIKAQYMLVCVEKEYITNLGQYVNGIKHGKGTLIQDGAKYEGDFTDGVIKGKGILTYDNGNVFEGGNDEYVAF